MIQNNNNFRKTVCCFAMLFMVLLGFPIRVLAQEAQQYRAGNLETPFSVQSETVTYTPLSGGTAIAVLSADDAVSGAINIGFPFTIGCNTYTQLYASSNGYLSFGGAAVSLTGSTNAVGYENAVIAPLWDDLSGVGGVFSYQTTGTAPNRVFTAEWKNWKWRYGATGPVISFQVVLHEGSTNPEFIYNQEATAPVAPSAAIGMVYEKFNSIGADLFRQIWLTNTTTTPGVSVSNSNITIPKVSTRPASGQLYRIINTDICNWQGQTLINGAGGTKPIGATYDGIRINLSATGNMQIRRKNTGQIYSPSTEINTGTTNPYAVPGTLHGLVLSVGNTAFTGGTLNPGGTDRLAVVSSTKQSDILQPDGKTYIDVLKMSATKNGLTYGLEVKYTYVYPESNVLIDYKVTIPAGNTEKVKLAHGWDTYLENGDNGPGITTGTWNTETDRSNPGFLVGTKKAPSYEAFQYIGGVPWDGYYSAVYSNMNSNLGAASPRPYMTFNNTIDPTVSTDNGAGISMDFGSTPGTYDSNNALIFACVAGDVAPTLSSATAKPCTGTNFNLNSYLTSTPPAGASTRWRNASGVIVADPTNVNVAGVYTVEYYSIDYDCSSPTATLTVTYDNTCAICYKPAVTTGTAEPFKTIISTLDRTNSPRNWSAPRTGSLILESTNKGLVLTRIASPETAITSPVEGMIVYDTVNKVIKLYNGSTWHTLTQQGCPD